MFSFKRLGLIGFFLALCFSSTASAVVGGGLGRILGGTETSESAYPWMVSIQKESTGFHFCGGTLIDKYWVLTAAHCVTKQNKPVAAGSLQLVMNEHKLSQASGREKIHRVAKVVVHPNFNLDSGYSHDIALLQLARPETDITPMAIKKAPVDTDDPLAVIGWGWTLYSDDPNNAQASDVLLQVNLKAKDSIECQVHYNGIASINSDIMLCAGSSQVNQDACKGDSGGPLFSLGSSSALVGVVSFGEKCGLVEYPGVYTRLSAYTNWINGVQNQLVDPAVAKQALVLPTLITLSLAQFEFDTQKSVRFSVQGKWPVRIHRISVTGSEQSNFSVFQSDCLNQEVQPQSDCSVRLSYLPVDSEAKHRAKLEVIYEYQNIIYTKYTALEGRQASLASVGTWGYSKHWIYDNDSIYLNCSWLSSSSEPSVSLSVSGPKRIKFFSYATPPNQLSVSLDGAESVILDHRKNHTIELSEGEHSVLWSYDVKNAIHCMPLDGLSQIEVRSQVSITSGSSGGYFSFVWFLCLVITAGALRTIRSRNT